MIYELEAKDERELKAVIYKNEKNNEYELMAVKGVSMDEMRKIISMLFLNMTPNRN